MSYLAVRAPSVLLITNYGRWWRLFLRVKERDMDVIPNAWLDAFGADYVNPKCKQTYVD